MIDAQWDWSALREALYSGSEALPVAHRGTEATQGLLRHDSGLFVTMGRVIATGRTEGA